MNDYLREYDAKLRARARELASLRTSDDIRAWYAADGNPMDESDNPWACAFGTLQAITSELLRETANA